MSTYLDDVMGFIEACPSPYHVVREAQCRLEEAGFSQLAETQPWTSLPHQGFVIRDGAIVAWSLPKAVTSSTAFRVVGSHTDAPCFTLKPHPMIHSHGWWQAGVEVYGSPLLNSWLDRELGLAGRLVTLEGESHLVRTGPIARIAQLAVHLDKTANEALHLDRQSHLVPVLSCGERVDLHEHLARLVGLDIDDIARFEVRTFPVEPPARFGIAQEFLAGARLDNLCSVHASLSAMMELQDPSGIAVLAAFDHEEIGSTSRSGAVGPMLMDILSRIADQLELSREDLAAMLARSVCLSADAAHAVHPNYPQRHDANHEPLLNAGPVLKLNDAQRYATDGSGIAHWYRACARAGVPSQEFVSNNSVGCGSTIGPLTAVQTGMTTFDVGIALLGMHSAREMAGCDDIVSLARVLASFWSE